MRLALTSDEFRMDRQSTAERTNQSLKSYLLLCIPCMADRTNKTFNHCQ